MKFFILSNILYICTVYAAQQRVDPLVLLNQGLVRGQRASDGDYSSFLGIPYAKVDVDNPFGASQAAPEFEDEIFYANDNSIKCPQTPFGQWHASSNSNDESVDCLQLSIYVPSQASTSNPLPVLVWIHGGAFMGGSANEYNPRNLVRHDIIVVTVNYRLGPYGFMCLDEPTVPGNQGLKDQYNALQWVRDNIVAFGGNPYNVTLAGQDAGSASVLLQLYSSRERLFSKVIAESGTYLSPDFFSYGDPDAAVKIANYLGMNSTNNQQALEFLSRTHHTLVTGAVEDLGLLFTPCKETSFSGVANFVDSEPYALSNERMIRNTPILIGNTEAEYLGDSVQSIHGEDYYNVDFFYARLQQAFTLDEDQLNEAAEIVRHYYIGDSAISEAIATEAAYFNSDFVFNHPIQDTITSLIRENASPVYEYVFTYVASGAAGASHSAELPYLFTNRADYGPRSDEEQLMVNRLTTLWTNFVKYGNPTPGTSDLLPVTWTAVTESTRPYLNIGTDLRMEQRFEKERMAFWDLFHSVYGRYSNLARSCDHMH